MFWIIVQVAFRELRGSWSRSLLTMLGVIIGVAAVVAMVALGQGAKHDMAKNIENLGANLLIIRPGLLQKGHVRKAVAQTLTLDDAFLIRKKIRKIVSVAPTISQAAQVKYFNKNTRTNIIGVTPDYLTARKFAVDKGKFFTLRDVAGARRVTALGKTVAEELFGLRPAVGRYIKINGVNFLVTAVMAEKGHAGWWDADDQILIPITTYQKRVFGGSFIRNIFVEVDRQKDMKMVSGQIITLLRKSHRVRKNVEADFHVRSQVDILKSMESMTKTFTYLLGGIAAISLVVGGIGIMNIMLVTVTERTREIGLRKALGAKKRDILKQFLVESIIISGAGGLLGVGLGALIARAINGFSDWDTYISTSSVLIAYTTALLVGIFFGWYPAFKAARLSPVDALRHE
ncbi:ABC-type antimicrobial peptide transport system, permease component [hydrothermal vent metagenome]|uniref:ABC-type antimicrobial peptide transport system, permease component n=1 Tax=hydrothermal vent metagenome TaxID=652676 RepID=A0A3B1C525_9ZZZZ